MLSPPVVVRVLAKGDTVLQVDNDRLVIRRKSGEVDVLVLTENPSGGVRLAPERSFRIGFGEGEVEATSTVAGSPVKLTTF